MKRKSFLMFLIITLIIPNIHGYNQEDYEVAKRGGNELNLIKADLSDLDTKEKNLEGANLDRADLTQASIQNTNLKNAHLTKAILYKAYLFKSDLSYANLRGARLIDAKLNCTNLNKTDFYYADVTNADFSGDGGFLQGIITFFKILLKIKNASLKNPNYKNRIETNFKRVKAINTNFSNTNLISANFEKSYLTNAKFNCSILAFANFSNVKSLKGTDFRGAVLFGANFSNTSFKGAIVQDVDFYGVNGLSAEQKAYLLNGGAQNVYTQEESSATLVQSTIRGYLERKNFEKMKTSN